jgi:Arc/MetJ family transcription regulator
MLNTHQEGQTMRTNIVIDDELMARALEASGKGTKRAAVELGLRLLIQMDSQRKLRRLKGRIKWDGDLSAMRTD